MKQDTQSHRDERENKTIKHQKKGVLELMNDCPDVSYELKSKIIELEASEEANLNILEDLHETIYELEKAQKEIQSKNETLYETQKELQILNKSLEKMVEERTKRIQKILKQKDDFINQLGHDLKNPLGPLINLLPILIKEETDPKKKDILSVMNRNVGYMKNLVKKTIELAQLNSPNTKFHFKPLCIHDEVENVIENNRILIEKNGITVINSIPMDIYAEADKLRFEELLNNLLTNSVKYTEGSGKVTFIAHSGYDFITVSLSDEGIGMDSLQLDHLFDEFYKADESRHDFESSGLGLNICKRIVEIHGGKIWVTSEGLGKGSTFYFTLKKSQPAD